MNTPRIRPPPDIVLPVECQALVDAGALVALNTSGGKDSQAMTILLSRLVPRDQLLAVHAPLGEVEWPGTIGHIERTLTPGVPLILAPVTSGKTLLEAIEERGRFPDSARRYCTSGWKRGPIERELRRYVKAHPRFGGRIVSAMGMRADESPARSKRAPWKRNDRNSRAGRQWFDWLPIHSLSANDVFRVIAEAGQSPHWAYAAGMSRLSCSFCILASRSDLRCAAELRPALYRRYVHLERRIGHTLSPTRNPLPEVTGVPVPPSAAGSLRKAPRLLDEAADRADLHSGHARGRRRDPASRVPVPPSRPGEAEPGSVQGGRGPAGEARTARPSLHPRRTE